MKVLTQKSIKITFVDDRFTQPIVVYRGKNAAYEFIKAILKEYKYRIKVMSKIFNKNLIMSQQSKKCWICENVIDNDEEKVRYHCQITGKFRGAVHESCNINLHLTKRVTVIFHNLRGKGSHLIFNELDKFDVEISVIPNGLKKYMKFCLNKNLVFIDSMQFMNSSLVKLVKNLSDEDFK